MLLDNNGVGDFLLPRGIGRPPFTDIETLAGDVSNIVVRVRTDDGQIVVKQSLETLAVADWWTAPTRRAITEAKVVDLLGSVTPERVPGSSTRTRFSTPSSWHRLRQAGLLEDRADDGEGRPVCRQHAGRCPGDVARADLATMRAARPRVR
jgi:hypothetical protein